MIHDWYCKEKLDATVFTLEGQIVKLNGRVGWVDILNQKVRQGFKEGLYWGGGIIWKHGPKKSNQFGSCFIERKDPILNITLFPRNLLGNRLTVPGQGMSAVNIKAEPADRDTASPNSRSSISPTSPYQVQRRIAAGRDDRDMDKDPGSKRPRLDPTISAAANGWGRWESRMKILYTGNRWF